MEEFKRIKYGMFGCHYKWDLAKAWITMSNDDFYDLFGFNWFPNSELREEVRKYL